jgi:hypothetical protein
MMKRIVLSITLVLGMMVYAGGAFCAPAIEGKWERFGDGAAGSIVQVEKVGDKWLGTLLKPMGDLEKYRFKTGEIVWKDLQKVANQKYRGTVLRKRIDSYQFTYEEFLFELSDENNLRLIPFVATPTYTQPEGNPRTFKRIQDK